MKRVCITGAAGNLGSLTVEHLYRETSFNLNLMLHQKPFKGALLHDTTRVKTFYCDLANKQTLKECLYGVDDVIHYAGVLFKGKPEEFLPTTNLGYFKNLIEVAKECGVKRVILISFPHVEGHTNPNYPSTDRIDRIPVSTHAKTRLEEERHLIDQYERYVILRVGMVYGRGILMPDGARWFAEKNLLGVWAEPTPIHLISTDDYLDTIKATLSKEDAQGIYNIGDDGIQTLQDYLSFACKQWGTKQPWIMPLWMIYFAAWLFEKASLLFNIKSPLTQDFIDIGRVSYYGDTQRMRKELLPQLKYSTMKDGKLTF